MSGVGVREFSGTFARMALSRVAEVCGSAAIVDVLRDAGEARTVEEITEDGNWSSYDQLRSLLEAAGRQLGGPERLFEAGAEVDLGGNSSPESTDLYQSLGGPGTIYATLGQGHALISSILIHEAEQIGPTEWIVRQQLVGAPAFEEFCWLCGGMLAMSPRLFGHANAEVVEETCCRRGDEWCSFRILWQESDDPVRRAAFFESRALLFERRFKALEDTVAHLATDGDLDAVLARIVESAARAVRMPAFVLAIQPLPWAAQQVCASGLDDDRAQEIAAEILDPDRVERPDLLVAEVASARRHYGQLAALNFGSIGLPHEIVILRSYARLAATALDSATAVAESRSQGARAEALLTLSTALADMVTTEHMATTLAEAVPAVTGADCAVVALRTDEDAAVRVQAAVGFPEDVARAIGAWELPLTGYAYVDGLRYHELGSTRPEVDAILRAAGVVALAHVPVYVAGRAVGSIVAAVRTGPERLRPNPELEARLRGLAGQASTALRNARLLEQIQHQAHHDELTGLPNRSLVMDRAEGMLVRARRSGVAPAALFIDLDGFKDVNDTLGHAAGDELLQAVADRLRDAVRGSDTIARLGGDEFVVLTEGSTGHGGPEQAANRILAAMREPFLLPGREDTPLVLSASIGIATGDRATAGDMLRDADVALYQAKAAGKDRATVFVSEMQVAVRDRAQLDVELRAALDGDQFFLVYQPIVDLHDDAVLGVEALLRWQHPERGVVVPCDFVPHLESSGLIVDVGRWVLQTACRQAARWRTLGHDLEISVNVSARQVEHDGFVDDVARALVASGCEPQRLLLEVTEAAIMFDSGVGVQRLRRLKDLGVRVAIDDFGTGYSSLAHLHRFPVDVVKLDRSFVSAIGGSDEATAVIHTLIQLGDSLGVETLGEGIEDARQLDVLREEGCRTGQGFLFARPMPVAALEAWLFDRGVGRTLSGVVPAGPRSSA
jgi:diguanylate cyclase (GGDEF)-like protein